MNQEIIEALKQLGGKGTMVQIHEITKIPKEKLQRLLETMYRRGEILKEFAVMGVYRFGHIGLCTKRRFIYKLIEEVGTY